MKIIDDLHIELTEEEASNFKGVFFNSEGKPELITEENEHLYGVVAIDFKDPPIEEGSPINFSSMTKEHLALWSKALWQQVARGHDFGRVYWPGTAYAMVGF